MSDHPSVDEAVQAFDEPGPEAGGAGAAIAAVAERPEAQIGAAFAGAFVFALILRRIFD